MKLKNGVCDWLQSSLLYDNCVVKSLTAMLETHDHASLHRLVLLQNPCFSHNLNTIFQLHFLKLKNGVCDWLQSSLLHDNCVGKSLTMRCIASFLTPCSLAKSLLFAQSQHHFSTSFFISFNIP